MDSGGGGGVAEGGRGGAYSVVAYSSHYAIDHVSLSRRRIIPTPDRDPSNSWAPITLLL